MQKTNIHCLYQYIEILHARRMGEEATRTVTLWILKTPYERYHFLSDINVGNGGA